MTRARLAGSTAVTGVAVALTLVGCGVQPTAIPTAPAITPTYHPSPSTSASVSDADVEAAIAAYLAYVDAGNAIVLSDPGTIERALAYTTDEQRSFETEFFNQLIEMGLTMSGSSHVTLALVSESKPPVADEIALDICESGADVHFYDAAGTEWKPPGRKDIQAVEAIMVRAEAGPGWLVRDTSSREWGPACSGSTP